MIEFNNKFQKAFDLMEDSSNNIFVSGKAGTGKSTLLTYFRGQTKKNVVVLAPTGTAAVNVNGETIHSFFGFKPSTTLSDIPLLVKSGWIKNRKLIQHLDCIVVDEISMVRADLLDMVDQMLKILRANEEAFGGIQMIFFGDLYQLPPVAKYDELASLRNIYKGIYFFHSNIANEIVSEGVNSNLKYIELDKIYRQKDGDFIEILNAIRNKTVTSEHLQTLNAQVVKDVTSIQNSDAIYLSTINEQADRINLENLERLQTNSKLYSAEISGNFGRDRIPTFENLTLKIGARIMMLNNQTNGNWINGTLGRITDLFEDKVGVKLDNGFEGEVSAYTWELYKTEFDVATRVMRKSVVASFTQLPIRLAWAITIHKSQGKTFEKVLIDLGRGAFSEGQTYVAISRCTSLEGLQLVKPVRHNDVKVDKTIVKFLEELQQR